MAHYGTDISNSNTAPSHIYIVHDTYKLCAVRGTASVKNLRNQEQRRVIGSAQSQTK